MQINRFYEFLFRHEEFVFIFDNTKYEIVYNKKLQLYKHIDNNSILIQEFNNCDDFFNKGKLNNQYVKDIYLHINTEF